MTVTAFIPSTSFVPRHNAVTPSTSSLATRPVLPHSPTQRRPASRLYRTHAPPVASVTVERLANKSFQLEEDEDASSCTSAVFLNADGTMSIGRTDGPSPDRVEAAWNFNPEKEELVMDIERYFSTGQGGVEFMVRRVLVGHLDASQSKITSDLPVFTGAMYPQPTDYGKHTQVGFFAMILATDDLPTEDFDISKSEQNGA